MRPPSLTPDIELFLCHHTAERAPEIAAAIGRVEEIGILALEYAVDDHDPATDPREVVGATQNDLHRHLLNNEPLDFVHPNGFFAALVGELAQYDHGIRAVFMVDVARNTFTAEDVIEVLENHDETIHNNDLRTYAASPAAYILTRALRIAEAFEWRETVVADQMTRIVNCLEDYIPAALVMGADHYYISNLLRDRGLDTRSTFVHPPSPTFEVHLSTLLRRRNGEGTLADTLPEEELGMYGVADMIYYASKRNNYPYQIYDFLRSKHLSTRALEEIAEAMMCDGTHPIFDDLPYQQDIII